MRRLFAIPLLVSFAILAPFSQQAEGAIFKKVGEPSKSHPLGDLVKDAAKKARKKKEARKKKATERKKAFKRKLKSLHHK